MQIDITWGEPYAAKTQEVYKLQSPAVMHLLSTVTVGGQTVSSKQVRILITGKHVSMLT